MTGGRRRDVAGQAFMSELFEEARAAVERFIERVRMGEVDAAYVRRVLEVMNGAGVAEARLM